MNVTFTTAEGTVTTVKALRYAFPKKGNAPEGFHLIIGGEKVQAATTGGGKYPKYTYFLHDGKSYYLPKNVNPESGTTLAIEQPAPEAAPEVAAEQPAPAPEAVTEKPKRSRGKAKAE